MHQHTVVDQPVIHVDRLKLSLMRVSGVYGEQW